MTNDQWATANLTLKDKCGTRVEMRVQEPTQSEAGDRQMAAAVPDQPGRGLVKGPATRCTSWQGASVVNGPLPVGSDYGQDAVQQTCALIAQRWSALGVAPAPTLPTLPSEVSYVELDDVPRGTLKLRIGEHALATVGVNLAECPHFYAVGSAKSGRTTVLKTLITSIQHSFTPEAAKIIAFDVGLELGAFIDPAYLTFYSSDAQEIGAAAKSSQPSSPSAPRRRMPAPSRRRAGALMARATSS